MKLVISADHAGFPLKEEVRAHLAMAGHEVVDLGAFKLEPQDEMCIRDSGLSLRHGRLWMRGSWNWCGMGSGRLVIR